MGLQRYTEIRCDACGQADHIGLVPNLAERYFRGTGWVFKSGKTYCDDKCANKRRSDQS